MKRIALAALVAGLLVGFMAFPASAGEGCPNGQREIEGVCRLVDSVGFQARHDWETDRIASVLVQASTDEHLGARLVVTIQEAWYGQEKTVLATTLEAGSPFSQTFDFRSRLHRGFLVRAYIECGDSTVAVALVG